jgi:hypothetical protein
LSKAAASLAISTLALTDYREFFLTLKIRKFLQLLLKIGNLVQVVNHKTSMYTIFNHYKCTFVNCWCRLSKSTGPAFPRSNLNRVLLREFLLNSKFFTFAFLGKKQQDPPLSAHLLTQ